MLPFLKQNKKQDSGISMGYQTPSSQEPKSDDSEGLEAAARDLHSAVQSGDIKKIAAALKAAFEICDSSSPEDSVESNEQE